MDITLPIFFICYTKCCNICFTRTSFVCWRWNQPQEKYDNV